jgi:YVTN family beta-propeller protein
VTTYDDNRLYRINPAGNVVTTVEFGERQEIRWLGVGADAVWVSDFAGNRVWRIDPRTNRVAAEIPVGLNPTGLGFSPEAVWVTNHRAGAIQRIDPRTNRVTKTIRLAPDGPGGPQTIGYAGGDLWVTIPKLAKTARVDGSTGRVEHMFDLSGCGSIQALDDTVWLETTCEGDTLARLSSKENRVEQEGTLSPVRWFAVTRDDLWQSSNQTDLILLRADPQSFRITGRLDLGVASRGNRLAAGSGSIWVGGPDAVIRVDPRP